MVFRKPFGGPAGDAPCRAVGGGDVRMVMLERLELLDESIVLHVRDNWIFQLVVALVVELDLLSESRGAFVERFGLRAVGHAGVGPRLWSEVTRAQSYGPGAVESKRPGARFQADF